MEETPKNVPPEVIEALRRGDKQAAMKMLLKGRQVTGIKDVMQLLRTLQESGVLKEVKQQVKVNFTSRAAALPAEVVDALRNGNKIEAIRLLREATGIGLHEAKGTVESFEAAGRIEAGQAPEPLVPTAAAAKPSAQGASAAKASAPLAGPTVQPGLSPGEVPTTNARSIGFVVVLVVAAILVWLALK
jgi:ribosomal protein L7/L12